MAGLMPDNVDDNLDAAASPIALEREARDRKIDEARKRASPYEVELRIKRLAQQAGVSRQEARRLYEEGLKAVAEDASLIDSDIPGNSLTPNQLSRATQTLRDMAGTRRDAAEEDRRKKWSAMTYLAGGAQNLTGANRGMYAALADMPEEERVQSLQNMMPGAQYTAAVDAAAAKGDPESEARLLAIEANMENSKAERLQQEQQFTTKLQDDRLAREEASKTQLAQINAANAKALAEMNAANLRNNLEWETRFNMAKMPIDSEKAAQEAAANRESQNREMAFQTANPGLYDVMTGTHNTNAAIDQLKGIAARSDSFQYLPGWGFGLREAESMNDELLGLVRRAEMLGIQSPLADPAVRRELIKRWGYSSGWSGGRGGWFGNISQPMPDDLQ